MAKSSINDPTLHENYRSTCPVNYALEMFGDKWSLLILRDIIRYRKSTYGEFLSSDEHISTNILANRLNRLVKDGILKKTPNNKDKRKDIYRLTQKGIDLFPAMIEIILWSIKYFPEADKYYESMLPMIHENKEKFLLMRMKEIKVFSEENQQR